MRYRLVQFLAAVVLALLVATGSSVSGQGATQATRVAAASPSQYSQLAPLSAAKRIAGNTPHSIDEWNFGVPVLLAMWAYRPVFVPAGLGVNVSGWAVDGRAHALAGGVTLVLDGHRDLNATYGLSRPDVATALHNAKYTRSGFVARLSPQELTIGVHVLTIRILTKNRKAYFAPNDRLQIDVFQMGANMAHLTRLSKQTRNSIDFLNYGVTVSFNTSHRQPIPIPHGRLLTVGGWAIDDAAHGRAGGVFVTVDGYIRLRAFYGQPRPDVQKVLGAARYLKTGYLLTFPTTGLKPGRHVLSLDVLNNRGNSYYVSRVSVAFVIK